MSDGPESRRRWRALGALALGTAAFLLYLPSANLGPVLDDAALLADAALVDHPAELFGRGLFSGVRPFGGYYRPLTAFSFTLESSLDLGIGARHRVNALLHAGTTVGAFLLLAALLGRVRVAFAAALLFAAVPAHADAVVPVTGRGDLLAMGLMLAAWGAFRARRAGGGVLWLAASACLFGAALLSKESAAVLPVLLLAGEWVVGGGDPRELRRRPGDIACLLGVLLAYVALRTAVLGALVEPGLPHLLDNPLAGADLGARIVGAPRAWLEAARILVWPWPMVPDYSGGALATPGHGMTSLAGWGLALGLLAAWGLAVRRPGPRFLALTILLTCYLPVANLLVVAPVLLAPRLLLVPSLGFALLLAGLALGPPPPSPRRGRVAALFLAVVAVAWGATAIAAQRRFADETRFWQEAARLTPHNAKAWYNLGNARMRGGEPAAAAAAYERAVEEAPDLAIAWSNLGVARAGSGREEAAAEAFRRALRHDPALAQAHAGLGSILLRQGDVAAGERHLRTSLALAPDQPDAAAIEEILRRLEAPPPDP